MNRGLRSARIATYCSSGRLNCADCGSSEPKASWAISRARRHRLRELWLGEKTKSCPPWRDRRRASSDILESKKTVFIPSPFSVVASLRRFFEKAELAQDGCRTPDDIEGATGPLGDFQQAVLAVGEIEDPQHGHLVHRGVGEPADGVIEPPLPELRLALRVLAHVGAVALENVEDRQTRHERGRELRRMHEVQVVRRGVVLRKAAVRRPRQPADRQIEAGRAELALVIPVRRELEDFVVTQLADNVHRRSIDRGVAATTLLVGQPARVTEAGENEAVPDPGNERLVAG